ncbi:MAG: DUF4384 domain-containing protein [Thermodesulfobacteriota bacterium]
MTLPHPPAHEEASSLKPSDSRGSGLTIRTIPPGASVLVQGQEVGITPPDGLNVPWDQGEIVVRKRFYRSEALRYTFPPASGAVLLALKPLVSRRTVASACALLALVGAVVWVSVTSSRVPGDTEATITVITDPPGVSVLVDHEKEPRGLTNAEGRLEMRLRTGKKVRLTLSKDRFESRILTFDPAGPSRIIKTRLDCTKAEVLIRTDPGRIAVFINDAPAGETDTEGNLLLTRIDVPKTVRIACRKEGFIETTREITIPSLERVTLDKIRLTPVPGEIVLKATEPDAEVLLDTGDGEFRLRGKTDKNGELILTEVPVETEVRIKVVKRGWEESVLAPVVVPRDRSTRPILAASMVPATAKVRLVTEPGEVDVKPDNAEPQRSGSDGAVELEKIAVYRPHPVQFSKDGYETTSIELVVPTEYQGKVFTLPDPIRLAKVAPKAVEVTIQTAPAHVAILVGESPEPAGVSDESGRLTLGLPDAETLLVFRKKGFRTKQVTHKPVAGRPLSIELDRDKVTLVVRTVPSSVSVSAAGTHRGVTDAHGELAVTDLDRGVPVEITLEKEGHESRTLTLTPEEERASPPVVELNRSREETGRNLAELIANPAARHSIEIRTESPDHRFKIGAEIALHVNVEHDCHVFVVAVDRDGAATVLYPTIRGESAPVGKGQTVRVPPRESGAVLRAYPPAGETYVKAIATAAPLLPALSGFIEPRGSFGELTNPVAALKALRKRLDELSPGEWSSSGLVVQVVE